MHDTIALPHILLMTRYGQTQDQQSSPNQSHIFEGHNSNSIASLEVLGPGVKRLRNECTWVLAGFGRWNSKCGHRSTSVIEEVCTNHIPLMFVLSTSPEM